MADAAVRVGRPRGAAPSRASLARRRYWLALHRRSLRHEPSLLCAVLSLSLTPSCLPSARPATAAPAPPQELLFVEEPDLSEHDPSQQDGFRVVYDKECPFEMRIQESDEAPQEVGTLEAIRCKVAVQGDASAPTAVRVELSSEGDLFFHYTHTADERAFRAVRDEQRLMIEFSDYPNVLARSLNAAIKEPHTHLAVFIMNRDGAARLDFIQNLDYKFVELLSVTFGRSAEDAVRKHIAFRYNAMRTKVAVTAARLGEITAIIKAKNPSLLLQLQTGAAAAATARGGAGATGGGGGVPGRA